MSQVVLAEPAGIVGDGLYRYSVNDFRTKLQNELSLILKSDDQK